jgi:hypothetical protein
MKTNRLSKYTLINSPTQLTVTLDLLKGGTAAKVAALVYCDQLELQVQTTGVDNGKLALVREIRESMELLL